MSKNTKERGFPDMAIDFLEEHGGNIAATLAAGMAGGLLIWGGNDGKEPFSVHLHGYYSGSDGIMPANQAFEKIPGHNALLRSIAEQAIKDFVEQHSLETPIWEDGIQGKNAHAYTTNFMLAQEWLFPFLHVGSHIGEDYNHALRRMPDEAKKNVIDQIAESMHNAIEVYFEEEDINMTFSPLKEDAIIKQIEMTVTFTAPAPAPAPE